MTKEWNYIVENYSHLLNRRPAAVIRRPFVYYFQMLLNLHCNDKMNFNDGTCCKSTDRVTSLQMITMAVFLSFAAVFVAKVVYTKCKTLRRHSTYPQQVYKESFYCCAIVLMEVSSFSKGPSTKYVLG